MVDVYVKVNYIPDRWRADCRQPKVLPRRLLKRPPEDRSVTALAAHITPEHRDVP